MLSDKNVLPTTVRAFFLASGASDVRFLFAYFFFPEKEKVSPGVKLLVNKKGVERFLSFYASIN